MGTKKMGRPPVAKGTAKDKTVQANVSEIEKKRIARVAASVKTTVSKYCYEAIMTRVQSDEKRGK